MSLDLKKLRLEKNIPAKDMVFVVKELYPKYDKTVQSKCENGKAYGVCLLPDAEDAIRDKFAPELKTKRKKDTHRLTCRISCRLENEVYEELQRNVKSEGYSTMQDWLTDVVNRYNRNKKAQRNKKLCSNLKGAKNND